jgi:hypothetical protein
VKVKNRGQLFDNSLENASRSAPKKVIGGRGFNSGESAPRSQRSIHFTTPDNSQRYVIIKALIPTYNRLLLYLVKYISHAI